MNLFRKILSIFSPHQLREGTIIVFLMVVGAAFEALGIGVILPLISIMNDEKFLNEHQKNFQSIEIINIQDHNSFIILLSFLLIIIYLIKNAYIAWETKVQINFCRKNQEYFSKQLMAEYLSKPYLFHLNNSTTKLLRNVNNVGNIIFNNILISLLGLLTEVITVITIWIMLAYIDIFSATAVVCFFSLVLYSVIKFFRKKLDNQGKIVNEYSSQYLKWVNQGLGAIKETKVMRKEEYFLKSFSNAYEKYCRANSVYSFINQIPRIIIETVVVSGMLVLIILKVLFGNEASSIIPVLGVLAIAAFRLMPSANRIVNLVNTIKFHAPFFFEVYPELIQIKLHTKEYFTCDEIESMTFDIVIEVKNVSFKYPDSEKLVLSDISLEIPKGAFVGIVGPSGVGKTTFVDILLGLLVPSHGEIIVDNVDIHSNIRAWQSHLAYVPQNIYLIDGTISENIALGTDFKNIDSALMNNVLKMAEIDEFIAQLPNGINTVVGERGIRLSGGQRQRIGIARALYQQPNVLILDEATSALDNKIEKNITETILRLKGLVTIITIAHRISTLEQCDFKIVFNDNKIEVCENKNNIFL
ncbi:ABC transporter ATP-binding protein [Phascolarctobacterium sp.]|uniref:ABC transporter ATP-binding protein n=1 Tax=Phascolarctobacterium sp. TaxID=2049039 RepID=UPI003020B54A